MHNAPDPGVLCRGNQRARVLNGSFKSGLTPRKAHPVGIDDCRSPVKSPHELFGPLKVIRKGLNPAAKIICTLRMVCQSSDFVSTVEEKPGGVLACVTERSGDDHRSA